MIPKKPILLHTAKVGVLVFGYGRIGRRKVEKYRASGAKVIVVDPLISQDSIGFFKMTAESFFEHHMDLFQKVTLVLAATSNSDTNQLIGDYCARYGKLINQVDAPSESTFSDMLFQSQEECIIATSGASKSPYVSQYLLNQIQNFLQKPSIQKRIKLLNLATPILKRNKAKGIEVIDLDDEALERIYNDENN